MGKAFLFKESEMNQDYLSTFPLDQTVWLQFPMTSSVTQYFKAVTAVATEVVMAAGTAAAMAAARKEDPGAVAEDVAVDAVAVVVEAAVVAPSSPTEPRTKWTGTRALFLHAKTHTLLFCVTLTQSLTCHQALFSRKPLCKFSSKKKNLPQRHIAPI